MKKFNYIKAWEQLANPAFKALPQNMRDLFAETYRVAQDLQQDSNLDMVYPDPNIEPEFRKSFDEIPAEVLAQASRTIYCWGHWGPVFSNYAGIYWKFSRYADQSLRQRIGDMPKIRNISFEIDEGCLRLCAESNTFWTWGEICLATSNNYEKVKTIVEKYIEDTEGSKQAGYVDYDSFNLLLQRIKDELGPKSGFIAKFLESNKFMDDNKIGPFNSDWRA